MRVRGLADEIYFDEIFVSKAANRHGLCKFKQRLSEKDLPAYQSAVGKTIGAELDNGRPIFFGEVTEVSIEKNFRGSYVEVTAQSISFKTDELSETRIFQSPEKKFNEILNSSRLNLKSCALALDEKFSSQACPEIILQHDETNFNFIKRLAAWQGRRVWVNDTRQGKCSLKVAPCVDETPNEISDEEIIRLKLGRRGALHTAELVASKYLELGRVLKLSGSPCKFLIVAQEIYQDNGVDRVRFELEEFKISPPKNFPSAAPVKLKAKVVEVEDKENFGRLRVQFDIEDKDAKKFFLPYRTPYSGIIFMPEVGDAVEIFYSSGECFVDSILRTKTLDDEFKKVTDKYIGNNRKQRIFFREKSLEIKSTDASIFLDDKKIILSVGENKITLDEQGVTIKTGGKILSDSKGDTSFKAGGKIIGDSKGDTSFKSDGKIIGDSKSDTTFKAGGKFSAKADGKAQISGSSVELG